MTSHRPEETDRELEELCRAVTRLVGRMTRRLRRRARETAARVAATRRTRAARREEWAGTT
jgi:hypothetical protein